MKEEKGASTDKILLILASLFYNDSPIRGRTRFQKIVFLLKEKYGISFDFEFKPYYYGPYSEELSDTLSLLTALKFLEEHAEHFGMGMTRYDYRLTERGRRYFEAAQKDSKENTQKIISKIRKDIAQVNTLPTPELVSNAKSLMKSRYERLQS